MFLTRQFGHELGTANAMELMAKIVSLPEKLDASGLWGLYSISYFFPMISNLSSKYFSLKSYET